MGGKILIRKMLASLLSACPPAVIGFTVAAADYKVMHFQI